MPAAPQQQGGGGDNSLAPIWITVGIFVLMLVIWYFAHDVIVKMVFTIKLLEAYIISLFSSGLNPTISALKALPPDAYGVIPFDEMLDVSTTIGNYFRFLVVPILVVCAVVLYVGSPALRFKKAYNMKRLADEEKVNWPQISSIVNLDLAHKDIDTGPWAMAQTPVQFAKKYNLLILMREAVSEHDLAHKARLLCTCDKDAAHRIFTLQLGRYWSKPEDLPPYAQALFAIFAARVDGDRDGSTKLLRQLGASAGKGKMDYSGATELLNKHKDSKLVQKVLKKHAYVNTVMASMLVLARTDGVLASAEFLWLKPVDRVLWYVLNCVGRQTAFVEVSGIFAHWLAEKEIGRRIYVPMVDEAVNALEVALNDIIYTPEEGEIAEDEEKVVATQ
jgi:intracellular multiplication protein IcmP